MNALKRAGFWRRFAASWIDMFIVYCGANCFLALSDLTSLRLPSEPVFVVLAALYGVSLLASKGGTIGKQLLNVRVTLSDNGKMTCRTAIFREAIGKWFLVGVVPILVGRIIVGRAWIPTVFDILTAGLMLLLLLLHYLRTRRMLYDIVARTEVVRVDPVEPGGANRALVVMIVVAVLGVGIRLVPLFERGWIPCSLSLYRSTSSVEPYTAYLKLTHETPLDYVIELYDKYDIVVLCERPHPEATQWDFILRVVSDPRFIRQVGHVYTEYGNANLQPFLDHFMTAPGLSEKEIDTCALHILRNMPVWPVWTYPNFFVYLKRLYALNQSLPPEKQIRHYLTDRLPLWEELTTQAEYRAYNLTLRVRDQRMAQLIIDSFKATEASPEPRKKCLVIMNYRHAFGLMRDSEGRLMENTCTFLCEEFPGRVANVLLNPDLGAPIQGGTWDVAFETVGNAPSGFSFAGSPFGADPFDLFPFVPATKGRYRYGDVFTGFVFVHPRDEQSLLSGIPGYFDGFEGEALRRASLVDESMYKSVQYWIAREKTVSLPKKSETLHKRIETQVEIAMLGVVAPGLAIGLIAWLLGAWRAKSL
jgi:uncharacterized RDD family membrane protein YckC